MDVLARDPVLVEEDGCERADPADERQPAREALPVQTDQGEQRARRDDRAVDRAEDEADPADHDLRHGEQRGERVEDREDRVLVLEGDQDPAEARERAGDREREQLRPEDADARRRSGPLVRANGDHAAPEPPRLRLATRIAQATKRTNVNAA